jgi:hypothetical protein
MITTLCSLWVRRSGWALAATGRRGGGGELVACAARFAPTAVNFEGLRKPVVCDAGLFASMMNPCATHTLFGCYLEFLVIRFHIKSGLLSSHSCSWPSPKGWARSPQPAHQPASRPISKYSPRVFHIIHQLTYQLATGRQGQGASSLLGVTSSDADSATNGAGALQNHIENSLCESFYASLDLLRSRARRHVSMPLGLHGGGCGSPHTPLSLTRRGAACSVAFSCARRRRSLSLSLSLTC